MDPVLRSIAVYLILLLLFRFLGKRSLAQVTMFDFVILLIVSEATQQALLGEDYSVTAATLVIATLLLLSRLFDVLSYRFGTLDKILNDLPIVLLENGRPIPDRMRQERVDEGDILERARELQGLERLDQIRYAVLERDGQISVIPAER